MPFVKPKRFFASQVSTLDVPYMMYFPLNFNKARPRSQSSPPIQSKTRSTPSGAILQDKDHPNVNERKFSPGTSSRLQYNQYHVRRDNEYEHEERRICVNLPSQ